MNKLTHLLSVALVLCLTSAHAQQNSNSGGKMTFSCAGWEKMDDKLYYIKGGSEKKPVYEQIEIPMMTRSEFYKANRSGYLALYKKISEEEYEKVARAKIPASPTAGSRYLLLFLSKKKDAYRIKVIPDGKKDSPFGAYQFFNFSKVGMNGMLADKKFKVAAGKSKIIDPNAKHGEVIRYATFATIDGKRQWLQRNTFPYHTKKHTKCFIYQVPMANGKFRVKMKALINFKPTER